MKTLGLDLYNFAVTGDKACNMNANSNMSANHAGPTLLILNDQGGSVMDVSEDVTATLRAQDHGHPPVICFEPGIMSRDCSAGNRAYVDICSTLRAQMGDNQPAICFQQNQREEVRDMGEQAGALTAEPGMHNTNYICYAIDHVVTTGGNCTAQGPCWYENICPTEKASGVHAVCFQNTGHGWWNQDEVAQTLRTPCGGDSMKANLILVGEEDG